MRFTETPASEGDVGAARISSWGYAWARGRSFPDSNNWVMSLPLRQRMAYLRNDKNDKQWPRLLTEMLRPLTHPRDAAKKLIPPKRAFPQTLNAPSAPSARATTLPPSSPFNLSLLVREITTHPVNLSLLSSRPANQRTRSVNRRAASLNFCDLHQLSDCRGRLAR